MVGDFEHSKGDDFPEKYNDGDLHCWMISSVPSTTKPE